MQIGNGVGGLLGSFLEARLSLAWVNTIGMCFFCLSFLLSLAALRQISPERHKALRLVKLYKRHPPVCHLLPRPRCTSASVARKPASEAGGLGILRLAKTVLRLQRESLATYLKPRSGNKRAFLLVSAAVYLVINSLLIGLPLASVLYRRPLEWSPSRYSLFSGLNTLTSLVCSLAAVFGLKLGAKTPDTLLIALGLASTMARLVCLGLASEDWVVFLSIPLNAVSGIAFPANKAFVSSLVRPDEVGKVFAIYGVALDLGIAGGVILFNYIYILTVAIMPGFVFLFGAGLALLCLLATFLVHFAHQREQRSEAE